MATLVVYANSANGMVQSTNGVYATARAGGTLTTTTVARVGQRYTTAHYCYESFFWWDTSALTAGVTVSASVADFYGLTVTYVYTGFTCNLRLFDWGNTRTVAGWVAGGSLEALTLLAHAAVSTSTPTGAYTTFTSDALAANISKTGYTRALMSSSRHEAGDQPSSIEYMDWSRSADYGTAPEPKLTITYTLSVAPTVTTSAESNVQATTATSGGNITVTGGVNATVRGVCWVAGSGTPTTAGSKTTENGSFGTGAFTAYITGLSASTLYTVCAYATNSVGTAYGASDQLTTPAAYTTHYAAGTLTGAGSASGASIIKKFLAGTFSGAGTLSGGISRKALVAGTLSGVGGASAALLCRTFVDGTLAGVGALSGGAIRRVFVSGALSGQGVLTGAALARLYVAGQLAGSGLLGGTLTGGANIFQVSGVLGGTGLMTGSAKATLRVVGSLSGVGLAAASVRRVVCVSGALSGAGALTGAVTWRIRLQGTLTGIGLLEAGEPFMVAYAKGQLVGISSLRGVLSMPSQDAGAVPPRYLICPRCGTPHRDRYMTRCRRCRFPLGGVRYR